LGHVEAMEDFYRAVDVVILTSHERSIEASPNALLEAMATGRPVVATAVGGVPELVTSGRDGYLARDDDAACFAARLLALLYAPARRARLGRNGRMRAALHGVPIVVEELAQRVRSVVAGADPPLRGASF
jgi:glycosyltransferase involved in cell wall biosynthesis